jgi:hypothetical protein
MEGKVGHFKAKGSGLDKILPLQPSEGTNPAEPCFQTSSLHNCKTIDFYRL